MVLSVGIRDLLDGVKEVRRVKRVLEHREVETHRVNNVIVLDTPCCETAGVDKNTDILERNFEHRILDVILTLEFFRDIQTVEKVVDEGSEGGEAADLLNNILVFDIDAWDDRDLFSSEVEFFVVSKYFESKGVQCEQCWDAGVGDRSSTLSKMEHYQESLLEEVIFGEYTLLSTGD